MDTKIIGDKSIFAIEYFFVDEQNTEISIYNNGNNILAFVRDGNTYTTRWNLDSIAFWLRDFIDNIDNDPYPVEVEGIFAAQKDSSARNFDSDDDEEFDAYYDKLDEWNQRHRWHTASDGAIVADLYFQLVGDMVEVSWNNEDLYDDVSFVNVKGGFSVNKDLFVSVTEEFLNDYADKHYSL